MRSTPRIATLLAAVCFCIVGISQPKNEKLKKPKQYEERKLGSEKMAEKKFTVPRHVFQNMYTHFNYYFNANNKLKEIIAGAKAQHQEDYSQLLPFYNYSFDNTATSSEIDSILEKCTAGILLHDLRNDWIDNLYLIMGRAYMLRKDFDSAAMTFQYINYAYSPKEKDGYDKVIGSNRNEGGNAFTISTKEKRNVVQKVFTKAPSRNESFVWQIRNYTEKGEYIDAASLITTLRNDPNFPPRLKEELAEVEAYNYYQQQIYDSSANYLVKAVSLADNRTEKARWYYLIGQMYQMSGDKKQASDYFAKCVQTTVDPVMEVYARLSSIRLRKADDPKIVQENIDEILRMARREKYEMYRDIIYYAVALVEIERNGYAAAENYLNKSIQYNTDNDLQRSKTFLLLSDMLYDTKAYGRSGFYYDSVNTARLDSNTVTRVTFRKPPTKTIYDQDRIINAQDSLLKIAAMPEAERNAYVKALSKKLRKERGLKEEVDFTNNTGRAVNPNDIGRGSSNLFDDNSKEFYFYNPQQRANGFNEFKQRWGARPNVDNWRRSAAVQSNLAQQQLANTKGNGLAMALNDPATTGNVKSGASNIDDIYEPKEVTFDALSANLPLEPEKVSAFNKSINEAMLPKAKALQNSIEDLPEAIKVYEALLDRLSENDMAQEVIFNLIYCYEKTGDLTKANLLRSRLNKDFKEGEFTKRANNPNLGTEKANPAATEAYKKIYNQFIEGDFQKALAAKKIADSLYGKTYWNPQLLYIESVYYVKERDDSAAVNRLNVLAATYPTSPLAEKARHLAEVLGHRKQIEDYLTKLQVTRLSEDSVTNIPTMPVQILIPQPDTTGNAALLAANKLKLDSIQKIRQQQAAENAAMLAAEKARQDSVKNTEANKLAAAKATKDSLQAALASAKLARADSLQKATTAKLAAAKSAKDSALIAQAAARQARLDSLKDAAAAKLALAKARQDSTRDAKAAKLLATKLAQDSAKAALAIRNKQVKDSITNALAIRKQQRLDSIADVLAAKRMADSLREVEARKPKPVEGFLVDPTEPQMVMILLNKVDPIYQSEGLNAFNKYNLQRLGQSLSLQKIKLNNDYSLITISSPTFTNVEAAMAYINKVKPKATTEIVPWLDASKFSFFVISPINLQKLQSDQNINGYLKALRQSVPNTF